MAGAAFLAGLCVFGARTHWVEEADTAERDAFVAQAEQVLAGETPRDPYRPPLYPYAIAALTPLAGDPFTAARLLANLSAAALALLAFGFGRRLAPEEHANSAGLWAFALVAANPNTWTFGQHATTDMPFAAFAAAALLAGLAYLQRPRWSSALAAGLAFGAAAATRDNAVLLAIGLLAAWWLARRTNVAAQGGPWGDQRGRGPARRRRCEAKSRGPAPCARGRAGGADPDAEVDPARAPSAIPSTARTGETWRGSSIGPLTGRSSRRFPPAARSAACCANARSRSSAARPSSSETSPSAARAISSGRPRTSWPAWSARRSAGDGARAKRRGSWAAWPCSWEESPSSSSPGDASSCCCYRSRRDSWRPACRRCPARPRHGARRSRVRALALLVGRARREERLLLAAGVRRPPSLRRRGGAPQTGRDPAAG